MPHDLTDDPAGDMTDDLTGDTADDATRATGMEQVALYDRESGRAIGAAPRSRVRARNLPHAATTIFVRDDAGRLLVHRRSVAKDLWPGLHDAACGGVVTAGERPLEGALRELAEEIGVQLDADRLRPLLRAWYADDDTTYLAFGYEVVLTPAEVASLHFADGEVDAAWWLTLPELTARLADPHWPFVPDTRRLLDRMPLDRTFDRADEGTVDRAEDGAGAHA